MLSAYHLGIDLFICDGICDLGRQSVNEIIANGALFIPFREVVYGKGFGFFLREDIHNLPGALFDEVVDFGECRRIGCAGTVDYKKWCQYQKTEQICSYVLYLPGIYNHSKTISVNGDQ